MPELNGGNVVQGQKDQVHAVHVVGFVVLKGTAGAGRALIARLR